MAFIYRSATANFVIDTPIVGLPASANIIYVSNTEDPKYNGVYILENPQAETYLQKWRNTIDNNLYIEQVQPVEDRGFFFSAVYGIRDQYFVSLSQSNPSDGYYSVLSRPYLAQSGIGSSPDQWYWTPWDGRYVSVCNAIYDEEGNVMNLICTTAGGQVTGQGLQGKTPQTRAFNVFIPPRVLVSGKYFVS